MQMTWFVEIFARRARQFSCVHFCQNSSVVFIALSTFIVFGKARCDGLYVKTNETVSPALTVNSDTVFRFSPCIGADVRSTTILVPAIARNDPSSSRVTQGTD